MPHIKICIFENIAKNIRKSSIICKSLTALCGFALSCLVTFLISAEYVVFIFNTYANLKTRLKEKGGKKNHKAQHV